MKHLSFATIGATIVAFALGNTALAATFEIIAIDLDNPRGLNIESNGALYVTEVGRSGAAH